MSFHFLNVSHPCQFMFLAFSLDNIQCLFSGNWRRLEKGQFILMSEQVVMSTPGLSSKARCISLNRSVATPCRAPYYLGPLC